MLYNITVFTYIYLQSAERNGQQMNCITNSDGFTHCLGRSVLSIDKDWRFLKLTQRDGFSSLNAESSELDDGGWETVSLPHTWNAEDGAAGSFEKDEGGECYYRGLGAYRKKLFLPSEKYAGKRLFIEFEGANTVTELFVNGRFVGKHEGGFSAFRFDITEYIALDGENLIAVKVSNAPTDYIAPITDQGDFTKMGGIYRDVSLIATEHLHIDLTDFGSSGVFVTPKNITNDSADIEILIKLANDGGRDESVTVSADILNAAGETEASAAADVLLKTGSKSGISVSLSLKKPKLWDGVRSPYLYAASVTVKQDGKTLDGYRQRFGIRTYRMDPKEGFFLNGAYTDLRGVNYHQDSYENGWSMTDSQRERDYKMILDMGCTSVRMAHYQHDGYEYDLCDRLGLTVWTEIGIVNKMSADDSEAHKLSEGFAENAKTQLIELIRQNYNHPSVIVWGISNELHQMTDEIYGLYADLRALAKREDETRYTTFADAQFWGKFLELPGEVVGYNRYFGWYKEAGPVEGFGSWLDEYHDSKELRPVCVSEYGGGGALSQFKDNINWLEEIDPWGERHYQNYQSAMHEKIWAQFSRRRYLWGKYIWCMFDFASNGRHEGDTVGQNDKGLATRERVPKDSYYFYKSVWNSSPMVHLTEKGFERRPCLIPEVKAYSNAEYAELYVNGVSLGKISRLELDSDYSTVFLWKNIRIKEDQANEIRVKGTFSDGAVIEDKAEWTGIGG